MTEKVATGTFRLKGQALQDLADKKGVKNRHQVSLKAGVSYPTIDKYFTDSENVESVHLRSLAGILVDAFGIDPDEVIQLTIGDLFDFVNDN